MQKNKVFVTVLSRIYKLGGCLALVLLLLAALAPSPVQAAERRHLVITVSAGSAPFEFVDEHGKPAGMFIDLWRLWARKTGADIEFRPVPWNQTLEMMKDGTADIHAGLFFSKKRHTFLDYGPELYASNTHIFYRRGIGSIYKPDDLRKFNVGVIRGDVAVSFFRKNYPNLHLTLFASNKAMFDAAENGTIKVFIKDTPIALYHLKRRHILSRFSYSKRLPLYSNMFYAGVRKGDKELLQLVKDGMAKIGAQERKAIESRWINDTASTAPVKIADLGLTADELTWLKQHKDIRLGVDPGWPPFEFFDQAGVYSGIASDYVKIISKIMAVTMRPVENLSWPEVLDKAAGRELDVLPCVVKSPARSRYLLFTKPYLKLPMVIVTRSDYPLENSIADFDDNRLAVVKDYISLEFLRRDFPRLKLQLVDSVGAGLRAVAAGSADGFVGNMAAISYTASDLGLTNIKVAATTKYNFNLSMAVRKDWPQLVPILDKALNSVGQEKRSEIYKYWTRVRIEKRVDWRSVRRISGAIIAFAALIIVIFAYWNRKLNLEIRRRRQSEHELLKLTEAVEQSSASVVITDRDGRIEYVNPHFSELTGYAAGEAIGQNPRVLKSGRQDEEFYANLWQTILGGQVWRGDFCNRKKNGEEYWESASIAPIRDEQGEITHFVAVKEDITRRKKMEDELLRARDEAEEASRAKSDFLAHMSHEIRTPMNAVLGMAHLCLQTPMSAKQTDYLQKIDLSARSLLQIINDLLDFSRIEAGKLTMEKVEFFLDEVLDNIASMTSLAAGNKGLELIFDRHAEVPDSLVGDPLRLGQIFLNLVNNAIKFTEKGQITVEIDATDVSEDSVTLQCVVRDSGIGIEKAAQERIFQSFSQADDSVTRRYGGTGLGLAISKKIVELMQGKIWLDSNPGQGSAFFFTVKLGRHRHTRKQRLLPGSLAGLRVLAVDDNETFLRVISEMLEGFGFQVSTAASGEEAVEMLREGQLACDLIMMDWNLPGDNGIETIRRLRQQMAADTIPDIILMTAYYDRDSGISAALPAEIGENLPLLPKPFTASTLLDTIVNVFCGADETDSMAAAAKSPDNISGARILVAEDNRLNLQVARELLQSWGVLVDTAADGAEVLEMFQKKKYDMILLDIQMPKIDGLTAAGKIRAQGGEYEKLPILAMTAHAFGADRQKSLAAGMNDHITKPLDPDSLRQTLARWLKGEIPAEKPASADKQCPEGLDCETALRRLAGNLDLYCQLLTEFCADNKTIIKDIDGEIAAGNNEKAKRLVHTLKGVSGNLGAMGVHEAAKRLEAAIINQQTTAPLLTELDGLLKALLPVIEPYCRNDCPLGAGEPAVSATAAPDAAEFDTALQELLRLVKLHDMDAQGVFNKLAPRLDEKFHNETEQLQCSLADLDFAAAQQIMADILVGAGHKE